MKRIKMASNENDGAYEYSRCEFYGTTIYSCTCQSYVFRKTCRHVDFLRGKMVENTGQICRAENGMEATEFVEKWGEKKLQTMKIMGEVFEKHGKLYRLE